MASDSATVAILGLACGTAIGIGLAALARPSPTTQHVLSSADRAEQKKEMKARNRRRSDTLEDLAMECIDGGEAVRAGFSMEEALQRNNSLATVKSQRSPAEVLSALQRGNTRFWMGVAQRPEVSAFERRALIMQQHPCVAILGCSDSRVPIEIVFDQGLGGIFVVRVAGNCLGDGVTASLEYAVHHLNVKCLVVMGHEGCGAVKAAGLPREQLEAEPVALREALLAMKEGIDEERLAHIHDARARDREAVVTNVVTQLRRLGKEHASVMEKIRSRELLVTGAFYEISSGIVDFFGQLEPSGTVRGWEGVVSPRKKAAVGGGGRRRRRARRRARRVEHGGGVALSTFPPNLIYTHVYNYLQRSSLFDSHSHISHISHISHLTSLTWPLNPKTAEPLFSASQVGGAQWGRRA